MIKLNYCAETKSVFSIYWECQYLEVENLIANRNAVIISDSNIYKQYFPLFKEYNRIILEVNENIKTIETTTKVISQLIEYKVDKNSIIIGLGGGTICDLTGFVASVYMRGVNLGFIPTTLLAQVDAAIGGKNAINFNNFKNYIGTFYQPEFIICNSMFFDTLSILQFKSGLGEIIKYALIADSYLFDNLIENIKYINNYDKQYFNSIVKQCIKIKTNIVLQDIRDEGIRNILNFGHTFGHCFELIDKLSHGIAVVKGMCVAIDLSVKKSYLNIKTADKIKSVFKSCGFDINYNINPQIKELLINDKKKNENSINFIYLKDIGEAIVEKTNLSELLLI